MPSNIQGWNSVKADFSDASRTLYTAQQGLSNAGTIFGQLRASILEEEQRRIDNALKEKAFNEGVRQFGITSAETARGNDLSYKASMAGHGVTRANALTSAGTARERLFYDMANQMSEATGNVPNYSNALQGPQQPYNNSSVMQGQYGPMLAETANRYGVPTNIFAGVIQQESGGNPNAKSPTGVVGLGQVTIPVMEKYGYTAADRTDPVKSADASARYLADLNKKYGNWEDTLIAYNGGDGAVQGIKTGVFPETWKEQMRKAGVNPEQKIQEVRGYAAMANRLTTQNAQRSIAGQRFDMDEANRQRQEELGQAITSAMQDYQKSENEIRLLEKQADLYDKDSPERKEIENEITQKKANRKFANASQLELALTTQYGSPEQKLAALSSNAKYERERALLNAEIKKEAEKTKAKYLREDGQAIDKHLATIDNPNARIAAWKLMDEAALRKDITSEEKVRMAAIIGGADTRSAWNPINWVRGSSNEAIIDNLLVQIRKEEGSPTGGNQSPSSIPSLLENKEIKDRLFKLGITENELGQVEELAQKKAYPSAIHRSTSTYGGAGLAEKWSGAGSNLYGKPKVQPRHYIEAAREIVRNRKEADKASALKQQELKKREEDFVRALDEELAPKPVHEIRKPVTNKVMN